MMTKMMTKMQSQEHLKPRKMRIQYSRISILGYVKDLGKYMNPVNKAVKLELERWLKS